MLTFKRKRSLNDHQIIKLAKQMVKVGVRYYDNPVTALADEISSLANVDDLDHNKVARDLVNVPLKYHALLIQQYAKEWCNVKQIEMLDTFNDTLKQFDGELMLLLQQQLVTIPEGYRTPLVVFDKLMQNPPAKSVAYDYLMADSSGRFASNWLYGLSYWGLQS